MEILILPVGPIEANCYIVFDESKEAMVIDPGAEGQKIFQEIEKHGLKVKYIVNTHGHGDHIGANQKLKELTGASILIHELDGPMLTDGAKNLSIYMGKNISQPAADQLLKDGDVLQVGKMRFTVLHTPGHTRGGICLLAGDVCFTGDTLFDGSIGRTDLPGGSYPELINSVKTKLFTLDDKIVVYPGHGPDTTIGREKAYNPFFR
ncbi:MAG: Hydroxyacylglutathione hydrolase [Peptococcaceae bacterium]|jgi:glyoxylase-like metal-dependent hydrolase (beta-lactamase superfamily II)|nr:Hydroxyacylglutathione hydrolase [Peptococcaceae bacterium]